MVMGLSTATSGIVGALGPGPIGLVRSWSDGPGPIGLVRSWSDGYAVALLLCIMLELVAAAIVLVASQKRDTIPSSR